MNITHLSQKLGLVVLAGFAVGTLSSCYYIDGKVPPPPMKSQDYNYILWVERSGKWQEVKEPSKFTFYVDEPIVYTAITTEKRANFINKPHSYTIQSYHVPTKDSKTLGESFNGDLSITREHNLKITYKHAGEYKQKHFVSHKDGQISNIKHVTINVVDKS